MKYVLDTHAIHWNISEPDKLGELAGPILLRARHTALVISDVSLSELARHLVAGNIAVNENHETWLETVARGHVVIPVSARIALLAASYAFTFVHKDPYDRHILATAHMLKLPLITVDATLTKAAAEIGVKVIW
ncbi:type II toxin-antitoxin system VapC family toxin [Geminisphaera colitermitum]|uniref:type II toxin-antitoxin system VapC family toxin n=1 Tax=Geminisphaera colitermitum TaxID=1148786 RepID=UPI0006935193|nr:PIN domain-containing protein [Geminisphaera colitermitum]